MQGMAGILVLLSKIGTHLGSLRRSLGSSCLAMTTRGASFDTNNIENDARLFCRDWADLTLYGGCCFSVVRAVLGCLPL